MHFKSTVLALSLTATAATAQVTVDVGPDPAPTGATVYASVTNDTELIMSIGGCPWRIVDGDGLVVFDADCLITEFLIGPIGTIDYGWDQRNQAGVQVPAGSYHFQVMTAVGIIDTPFTVGGVDANLFVQGTAALGTDMIGFGGREIALASPADPGAFYQVLLAGSLGGGVDLCGLTMPLAIDGLFTATLGGATIPGAFGQLDGTGQSLEPKLPIPDAPGLVGIDLYLSMLVLDPLASCPVVRSSPAFKTTIVPGPQPFGS
ncbi:hypothetical protein [Engelhardtia mirabilis]|uniref:Secreted protein n=1 Tax=Engelhardtia mirabilis TaxID=2528011 RepID=A0A518BGL1_9BACT|nr:hypothetical protein Pla133_11880 [Planctomycetes bacterium Pla133]QDV00449.1 hypothetical protein Pla86_11880 [Planctomycetes bacterium Pla86]